MIIKIPENPDTLFYSSRKLHTWLERWVFGSGLVFNQTWEDPAIDRQALCITSSDVVLSIASAGDNVLALALDHPQQIMAVDLNPAQIYLLQLKLVAIRRLEYDDFWHLFSLNPAPRAREIYVHCLRQHLDPDAQIYWDRHIFLFRRGLGCAGVFGRTLFLLRTYLQIVCGQRVLRQFFESSALRQQADLYCKQIHPRWWNALARPFADRFPTLLLFGAHPYQARRVSRQCFASFLASNIKHALTSLPALDNYFWQQVFLGRYLRPPDYAQPDNYYRLKEVADRITTHLGRLENLLPDLPQGAVTCFNLLDAPDWLSPEQTIDLWELIERAASPGAKVLFRTIDPDYRLPTLVSKKWKDMSVASWTAEERTGVYARVYLLVL